VAVLEVEAFKRREASRGRKGVADTVHVQLDRGGAVSKELFP
jgi:hypothetical protein